MSHPLLSPFLSQNTAELIYYGTLLFFAVYMAGNETGEFFNAGFLFLPPSMLARACAEEFAKNRRSLGLSCTCYATEFLLFMSAIACMSEQAILHSGPGMQCVFLVAWLIMFAQLVNTLLLFFKSMHLYLP